MASERRHTSRPTVGGTFLAAIVALQALACGSSLRPFPLRDPLLHDSDMAPVSLPCRPHPEKPGKQVCMPVPYESSLAWDAADNTVFRPISRAFAVDPGGEATNVNALDEAPESSWFTYRISRGTFTPEDVARGFCDATELDPEAPDGAWLIDQGKMNGANPGFRIRDPRGVKYMLKVDTKEEPERATGATTIAARIYYAAGWWAPCDSVVYVRPSLLRLSPGLEIVDNTGKTQALDKALLGRMLSGASRRGDRVRFVASKWLPGRAIGPFRYESTRNDDANDVVPHEDRRDLRASRLVAAWLNHFDSREQNTMDTWMSVDPEKPDASPGHVRHWILDLGDCFGSQWSWDGISRRLGHAHYLDFGYIGEDFVTFGAIARPWDRPPKHPRFGYFSAANFEPDAWRGGYPNPAFGRMTERDGAWGARVLAGFTRLHIRAAVQQGDFTEPADAAFLEEQLVLRHRAILSRYFARLSPLALAEVRQGNELCALDLARQTGTFEPNRFRYSATTYRGNDSSGEHVPVRPGPSGEICVPLRHGNAHANVPITSQERYVVVDVGNGVAAGPLRAHLYDLGARRGFRLVGLERPEDATQPR